MIVPMSIVRVELNSSNALLYLIRTRIFGIFLFPGNVSSTLDRVIVNLQIIITIIFGNQNRSDIDEI